MVWIPAEVEGGGGNASGQGAVSKSSTSILMKMAELPCFLVKIPHGSTFRLPDAENLRMLQLEMIEKLNEPNELQMNLVHSFAAVID